MDHLGLSLQAFLLPLLFTFHVACPISFSFIKLHYRLRLAGAAAEEAFWDQVFAIVEGGGEDNPASWCLKCSSPVPFPEDKCGGSG